MFEEDAASAVFSVVVNDEEQYSIWPAHTAVPAGWHGAGFEGSKQDCLAHIETLWTDMRPLSLRRWLAGDTGATTTSRRDAGGVAPEAGGASL